MARKGTDEEVKRLVQRRYAPKVRTGCITCKIRRVKCDEGKPNCQKCLSTGRECDGYDINAARPTSSHASIGPLPLSFDVKGNALERRTYDFFRENTVPAMAGYFRDGLWERLVLQASHSEPAVKHALNALAALHEEFTLREKTACTGAVAKTQIVTNFPLLQYTKALAELRKALTADNVSMDAVLICSLLLINYEALKQDFKSTLVHANHALQLLRSKQGGNGFAMDPELVKALTRVDVQGWMYLGPWRSGEVFSLDEAYEALPFSIGNLNEARDLVSIWTARVWSFQRTLADRYKYVARDEAPLEISAAAQRLTDVFVQLEKLLWDLMHAPTATLNLRENSGLQILRSRVNVNKIMTACTLSPEASTPDQYVYEFEEIVTLCEYVMSCSPMNFRMLCVAQDEGLLQPLWYVTTHCRDGRIRHRALRLLWKLTPDGAPWHAVVLTRIAEACIEYEEAHLEHEAYQCKNIAEWQRVHAAGMISTVSGVTMLRLRVRANGYWKDVDKELQWCAVNERSTILWLTAC